MPETEKQVEVVCPECGGEFEEDAQFCPRDGSTLVSAAAVEDDEDDFIGTILGERFRVESVLGEGGMGKVYKGRQLSVERPVAIKVIHSHHCDDQTLVQRFFREAKVISKFSHPNIVNAIEFDAEASSGSLYFVMEYIDGYPLEELVDKYHIHPALALEITKQTCEALSEPHEEGVVHRDIKPDNLMMLSMSDGKVQTKVVDFGVAHTLKDGNQNLTQTGMVYGTPYYMSPEQVQGEEVGPYTDTYALGVILYQMLAGTVPFQGDAHTEVMLKQIQEEPAYIEELVPDSIDLPPEVPELVHGMLRKDKDDRLDDVLEIRGKIEEIERDHRLGPVRIDPSADADRMFEDWVEPAGDVDPSEHTTVEEIESVGANETAEAHTGDTAGVAEAASQDSTPADAQHAEAAEFDTAAAESSSSNTWIWAGAAVVLVVLLAGGGVFAGTMLAGGSSAEDQAPATEASGDDEAQKTPSTDESTAEAESSGDNADEESGDESGDSDSSDEQAGSDESGSDEKTAEAEDETTDETDDETAGADDPDSDESESTTASSGSSGGSGTSGSSTGSGNSYGGSGGAAGGGGDDSAASSGSAGSDNSGGGSGSSESGGGSEDEGEGENLDLFTVD